MSLQTDNSCSIKIDKSKWDDLNTEAKQEQIDSKKLEKFSEDFKVLFNEFIDYTGCKDLKKFLDTNFEEGTGDSFPSLSVTYYKYEDIVISYYSDIPLAVYVGVGNKNSLGIYLKSVVGG